MKSKANYEREALYSQGSAQQNLELIQAMPSGFCVGEKDARALGDKEYLKEFARGPCNPTILLPGLLSVKMVATIDCEVLRAHDPDTFAQCGWNACKKNAFEVGKAPALISSFGKASRIKSICRGFPS